ncbi:MAG: hypothetical protein NYU39_00165 [Aigarchaeota archaeon]|nr:hypothetical protein [Candidatus Caldarchaeales archaeon]MDJ0272248.1 hypothetical protein [Candidatus Caldarchaeales archaeon]
MVKVVELIEEMELLPKLKKFFPHNTSRRYQASIANSIYESLGSSKLMLLEGPTGLGKRP